MSKMYPGDHEHIPLEGSTRCKRAQVYPRQMCKTVCEGIAAQKRADAINLVALDVMSIAELMSVDDDLHDDPCSNMQYIATDDVLGDPLKPNMVIAVRKEELDYFKSVHVYDYAPWTECISRANKPHIGTRWIDTNKGDVEAPNYRSRLVAKVYKVDARPDWFAATPQVKCMRLLISKAAESKSNKVLYVDISRAYFGLAKKAFVESCS